MSGTSPVATPSAILLFEPDLRSIKGDDVGIGPGFESGPASPGHVVWQREHRGEDTVRRAFVTI